MFLYMCFIYGEVYSIQHYVIKFVNDLRQVGDFLRFPSPIKLTAIRGGSRISSQGGGGALKKIAPSGERPENVWGISCEKSRFYTKKSYFFQFWGCAPTSPANGITEILLKAALNIITSLSLDIIVLFKRKHYLKFTYIQNFFLNFMYSDHGKY